MAIIHIINIIDKIIIVFFLIITILNYSFRSTSFRSSSSKNFFEIFVCQILSLSSLIIMSQEEPSPMGHLHSYQFSASETSAISGTFNVIALSMCSFTISFTSSASSIGASIIISSCTCKTIFAFNFLSNNFL